MPENSGTMAVQYSGLVMLKATQSRQKHSVYMFNLQSHSSINENNKIQNCPNTCIVVNM